MTGQIVTITYTCAVHFVEAHNFDATVLTNDAETIVIQINGAAKMKDGNDDYNFSLFMQMSSTCASQQKNQSKVKAWRNLQRTGLHLM